MNMAKTDPKKTLVDRLEKAKVNAGDLVKVCGTKDSVVGKKQTEYIGFFARVEGYSSRVVLDESGAGTLTKNASGDALVLYYEQHGKQEIFVNERVDHLTMGMLSPKMTVGQKCLFIAGEDITNIKKLDYA
jgi:hypothetical protein